MAHDNKIEGHEAERGRHPAAAEKILDVARDLVYRQGIRAIGVDEIVRTAGVAKPSLYRAFSSKDELAASYLRRYDREFWERFDKAVTAHPGDPRAQILAFLTGVGERTQTPSYRGCGMTNAAVEYPQADHPARKVSEDNKRELRRRLRRHAGRRPASPDRRRLYFRPALRGRRPGAIRGPQCGVADRCERGEAGRLALPRRAFVEVPAWIPARGRFASLTVINSDGFDCL